MDKRRNILYIFTDQQSACAMSCAGSKDCQTPNMDRLASRGVRFDKAYSVYPLCTPARAAMFSGRYPHEVGVVRNGQPIDPAFREEEMGHVFSRAGYDCAYGGKWHIPQISITEEHGFRKICGFDDTHLAERSIAFLREERDRPFLLVASFENPHNICEWGRDQPIPWGAVEIPPLADCPGLPANHAPSPYEAEALRVNCETSLRGRFTLRYSNDDWRRYRAAYARLVEKVDGEIGKILDELDRQDLWGNTLVVFSSDHGDMHGAHQMIQKSHFYDESSRVPFLLAAPGIPGGGVDHRLVHSCLDLIPTFCDYARIEAPEGLPGESVLSQPGGDCPWRQYLIGESGIDGGEGKLRMVRSERYKYVVYEWGRYREQLYDMENDPGEMVNLAVESRYARILDQHRRQLVDWCGETNDNFGRHYSHKEIPFNVPGYEFQAKQ